MITRKALYSSKLFWILLPTILQINVEAGPVKRSSRMAREVYPEIEPENDGNQAQVCIVGDVVYGAEEPVPAEQPCLKCRCQPPGVQCETIKCVKKSGCKAIHRPNKCCPDYQCECNHEGKAYANGERLKTPSGGECKVCYCRGGEVQCAEVSCYIRTDCEAKTVPGQCCPKYEHCPPKDSLLGRPIIPTDTSLLNVDSEVLELWPLTSFFQNSSEETTSPTIIDETPDANKIDNDPERESATVENSIKITKAIQADFTDDSIKQIEQPKITIHEIIPELKEIPITVPSKQSEQQDQLIIDEPKDLIDSNLNDVAATDSEPDSSEISEVFQQPPPVLRIGDKLLFLKQGELVPEKDASTPTSVITIIGAEGLQRGFEDSAELHDPPTKNYGDNSEHTLFNNSNDLELKTSESTHILSLVKHKKKPDAAASTTTESSSIFSSTVNTLEETSMLMTDTTKKSTTINSQLRTSNNTEIITTYEVTELSPERLTSGAVDQAEETANKTMTLGIESATKTNYDTLSEENPAYPVIPDVMSPQNIDKISQRFDNDSVELTSVRNIPELQLKILPEVLEIRNNKTILQNTTHGEWLKLENAGERVANVEAKQTESNIGDESTTIKADTDTEVTTEEVSIKESMSLEETVKTTTSSTEYKQSAESIEETIEDSGESTTPKNSHASIVSDENASVEPSENGNSESMDMVKEESTITLDDVEVFNNETENTNKDKKNQNPRMKDVEMIYVEKNLTNVDSDIIRSEKIQFPTKSIGKRENSPQDEADEVFRQLQVELNADNTQRTQTVEEEIEEADKIFRELLEETSTPKSAKKDDKDAETLQRVTDAIAKLTLGGRKNSLDTSILGMLSNFFSSQYKNNGKE